MTGPLGPAGAPTGAPTGAGSGPEGSGPLGSRLPAPGFAGPGFPASGLLAPGFVAPYASGRSLTRIPSTIGGLLGAGEGWRSTPLTLPTVAAGYRRVVLLLIDGLGYDRLAEQLERDDLGLAALLERHAPGRNGGEEEGGPLGEPLITVAPSTTVVATTVLAGNGASPGETGFLGYTQYLPRLGFVANMLFWRPAWAAAARSGDLEAWGLVPEAALPTPTAYRLLASQGVASTAFYPHEITRSPLSRMQTAGARVHGYIGWVDLLAQLGEHLEASAGERGYTFAYFPDLDSLQHRDGPSSPSYPPLLEAFVSGLTRLLERLAPAARRETLFLVTADHGHHLVPSAAAAYLGELPALRRLMLRREGGEPRHVYLYARPGATDDLLGAASAALGERFMALRGEDALSAGLYGDPAHLHPEAAERVGDVVLLAREGATLWEADRVRSADERARGDGARPAGGTLPAGDGPPAAAPPLGMHGSLTSQEMRVPLLILDLDAT